MSNIEHHGLILPSSPLDRQRMQAMFNEMVNCMIRAKSESEAKKDVAAKIHEEFDIPKPLIGKAAKIMFAENYQKVAAENEDLEMLYETLQLSSNITPAEAE